jgi:hypothetical protein
MASFFGADSLPGNCVDNACAAIRRITFALKGSRRRPNDQDAIAPALCCFVVYQNRAIRVYSYTVVPLLGGEISSQLNVFGAIHDDPAVVQLGHPVKF